MTETEEGDTTITVNALLREHCHCLERLPLEAVTESHAHVPTTGVPLVLEPSQMGFGSRVQVPLNRSPCWSWDTAWDE